MMNRKVYHTTITAGAVALAALVSVPAMAQDVPKKPNILIILSDDIGYSDTEVFGGEIRTPNIKKLADEGRSFTQFYNTARCCTSRASLLTGLYPHQAGVGHMLWDTGYPGYTTHLTSDSVTIPEALHSAGYRNYMVGKWHLSERTPDRAHPKGWPTQRGFDHFYGTLQGYGSYYDPATLCRDITYITPQNDPKYKPENYYYTDALSDNAVMYLKDHKASHGDKPFMMYLAYTAAHWPLHVPEESMKEYKGKYDAGYEAIYRERIARMKDLGLLSQMGEMPELPFKWDVVKDKKWEAQRMEAFAAIVTRMDEGIGKVLAQLKASGELDNTIVMFLQDNGGCDEEFFMTQKTPDNLHVMAADELQDRTLLPMQTRDGKVVKAGVGVYTGPAESFNGYGPAWAQVSDTPFRKVKKFTHEGGISTPLVVQWPAAISRAKDNLVSAPGHLVDIMPTVLEAAGVQYPAEYNGNHIQPVEGVSLMPLLTGKGKFGRSEPIFWEHEGNRAVRDGKWKLVAAESQPWELYDIETDRGEMKNLVSVHPDVAARLTNEWNKYADRAKVRPLGAWKLRDRTPDPQGTPTSVVLNTGDVYQRAYAPALSDRGVSITAHIARMAGNGVIVAQGGSANGYSLYMKDGRACFTVLREREKFTLTSEPVKAEGAVVITALLDRDGMMTLQAPGVPLARMDAYGPLLITPGESLTAGFEQATPVGDYEGIFSFQGDISRVELETVK